MKAAKLYTRKADFTQACRKLEDHFGLDEGAWAPLETVQRGDHTGKYILPLPEKGKFKADNLFSGVVPYDGSWHSPPDE